LKNFNLLFVVLALFSFSSRAQDTFSIVALDSSTGEIGAAGASCVDGIAALGGIKILNDIIPGRGGVNAQAWICINPHINLVNAMIRMDSGDSPQQIIDWLVLNDACFAQGFDPQYRQYGIVDFDSSGSPRTAAFTGTMADDYKNHITGFNYSIQGNTLLDSSILLNMEAGFNNTLGTLPEKLMAAMQGANIPGADSRCLARGTSSTSSFLRVYKPTDTAGMPWLELDVLEMPFGEEPIDSLQVLFNLWALTNGFETEPNSLPLKISVYPNPAAETLEIVIEGNLIPDRILIINTSGKTVLESSYKGDQKINVSGIISGLYQIFLLKEKELVGQKRFIKL